MYRISASIAIAATAWCLGAMPSAAGLLGSPMGLRPVLQYIKFDAPALPPMAYNRFCHRYEAECRSHPLFRGGPIRLTPERQKDLKQVNETVNRGITPARVDYEEAEEAWLLNPSRGDCNDYAVSKRHELLNRGWPARVLLLSEVVVPNGQHHLVLVVRTTEGDLVLDNLTPQIRPWARAPYRWVRMQLPNSSKLWTTIADRKV
jgi:predicted transglutaminase-like cysteine proteinase